MESILKDLGLKNSLDPKTSNQEVYKESRLKNYSVHKRTLKGYLKDLITSLKSKNNFSKNEFHEPYVGLEAGFRKMKSEYNSDYPKNLYSTLTGNDISPSIVEITGLHGSYKNITSPSEVVGLGTKKIRNVLKFINTTSSPVVLLGEPGAGKSTTLRKLAIQYAKKALVFPFAPIPVFVELGKFWQRIDIDPLNAVIELILSSIPLSLHNIRAELENKKIQTPLIIIFDGIDEIPRKGDYINRLLALSDFASNFNNIVRCIFSCRTNDFDASFGHRQIVIKPLNNSRIKTYLRKVFGKTIRINNETFSVRDVLRKLLKPSELGQSVRNPLNLSLVVNHIRETGSWPKGQISLFETHVASLSYRALIRENFNPHNELISRTVNGWAELAFLIFSNHGSVFINKKEIENQIDTNSIQLAISGGVIIIEKDDNLLKFRHQRLQEYLVGRRLLLPNSPKLKWAEIITIPRWQESLLYYFAIGGNNIEILNKITEKLFLAEAFFNQLERIIVDLRDQIQKAEKKYNSIKPDVVIYAVRGGMAERYSPEQLNKKHLANKELSNLQNEYRKQEKIPVDKEMEWVDHILFTSRLGNLLKPNSEKSQYLKHSLKKPIEKVIKYGRPSAQIRILEAWKEIKSWYPTNILNPLKESNSHWVKSQLIRTIALTQEDSEEDFGVYDQELASEILQLNLHRTFQYFWKDGSLSREKIFRLLLGGTMYFIINLLFFVFLIATSLIVGIWAIKSIPFLEKHSIGSFLFLWYLGLGCLTILSLPISKNPLILRIHNINILFSGIALVYLYNNGLPNGILSRIRLNWSETIDVILVFALGGSPAIVSSLILVCITVLTKKLIGKGKNKNAFFYRKLYETKVYRNSIFALVYAIIWIIIGAILVILGLSPLSLNISNILGFLVYGILLWGIGTLLSRIFKIIFLDGILNWAREQMEVISLIRFIIIFSALYTGLIALIATGISSLHRNYFPFIPSEFLSLMSLLFLVLSITLLLIILICRYVCSSLSMALNKIKFLFFRNKIIGRKFEGNLNDWLSEFKIASPEVRRELLYSFDYSKMNTSSDEALMALLSIEGLVLSESIYADFYYKTIYNIQETIRQQRWSEKKNIHSE